jgi:F-type H+-transporting ATPase subunit delta
MAASHRRYAEALYRAATDKGDLAAVRGGLEDVVASIREVPELGAVLRNPQLDSRAKVGVVEDLTASANELVRNTLLLLVEKGRIGEVEDVAKEFEALVAKAERRLELELTTAVELSDEEADSLVQRISGTLGRPIDARRSVDPGLIGGLVLQVGSLRLDASVRGRLDKLRRELAGTRS